MPPRPPVDVVIPFRGSRAARDGVVAMARRLEVRAGDSVVVVDNTPGAAGAAAAAGATGAAGADVRVLAAAETPSSYFARNRGAALGAAPWILFLDADVVLAPGLLDRYFDPPPADDLAVLVGAIDDEDVPPEGPAAARYAALTRPMSQRQTFDGPFAYAQTANCAVRRAAFEGVGGFTDTIRSGGDADLCFRLVAAGWRLEARAEARVVHRNRATVAALLRQRVKHGAGAGWLEQRHPGSFPPPPLAGTAGWIGRKLAAAARAARARDRDQAIVDGLDAATRAAFELGRRLPNRAG